MYKQYSPYPPLPGLFPSPPRGRQTAPTRRRTRRRPRPGGRRRTTTPDPRRRTVRRRPGTQWQPRRWPRCRGRPPSFPPPPPHPAGSGDKATPHRRCCGDIPSGAAACRPPPSPSVQTRTPPPTPPPPIHHCSAQAQRCQTCLRLGGGACPHRPRTTAGAAPLLPPAIHRLPPFQTDTPAAQLASAAVGTPVGRLPGVHGRGGVRGLEENLPRAPPRTPAPAPAPPACTPTPPPPAPLAGTAQNVPFTR